MVECIHLATHLLQPFWAQLFGRSSGLCCIRATGFYWISCWLFRPFPGLPLSTIPSFRESYSSTPCLPRMSLCINRTLHHRMLPWTSKYRNNLGYVPPIYGRERSSLPEQVARFFGQSNLTIPFGFLRANRFSGLWARLWLSWLFYSGTCKL